MVEIWARGATGPVVAELAQLGVNASNVDPQHRLLEATLDLNQLPAVAELPDVMAVTPVYRAITRAGSVQTQGDAVVRADLVRQAGFDGAAVKVGVISDSALQMSQSQATADLPGGIDRYLEIYGSDEGRAIMEIVHDVAPGAGLAFYSGVYGSDSFARGIRELAAVGCQVIVDDLGCPDQPFFQDGIVAQAVDEVTAKGVTYVSAAGNDSDLSYEADFNDSNPGGPHLHDFDPGSGVSTRQQITVPAQSYNQLILQWDDPFYTTAGVTHDFDVRVYDSGGTLVASSTNHNLNTQQPLEIAAWPSTGGGSYSVEIERLAGSGASHLKYVLFSGAGASIDTFATHSPTIFGQPAAAGAIAVGAVPYYDPGTAEPYSSLGDVTIDFDPAGNRLGTPVVRHKPDVVAPDGVNTTFFGVDIPQDPDTDPNFFGTSAAAPHVAGVAALLLDANPHLTAGELTNVLDSTAVDLGPAGIDPTYGYGRIDAEAARAAALAVPDTTDPTARLLTPINTAGWQVPKVKLAFSEPLDSTAASDPASYRLVAAGPDGTFGTADDVPYNLAVAYDAAGRSSTLTFTAPATLLPAGSYQLTLDATAGLADEAGNPLNGGADQTFVFSVGPKGQIVSLPAFDTYDRYYGVPRLGVRPDGTAFSVFPSNPVATYRWPQIAIDELDAGGGSEAAFREIPTTGLADSFDVSGMDVAVSDSGGVATYIDNFSGGFFGLSVQPLDAHGRPIGDGTRIGYADLKYSRVAANAAGQFAVVFEDYDGSYSVHKVMARLFDATATPLGPAFQVNQQAGAQNGVVAVAADGSSVYAWETAGYAIHARRFDPAGNPLGDDFEVDPGIGYTPEIGMAADGSFAVAWIANSGGVMLRRYDAAGNSLGKAVEVVNGIYSGFDLAVAPDGRIAVAWDGVFVQRIAADGTFIGGPLWVTGSQVTSALPQVGFGPNDQFLVTWVEGQTGQARGMARWYSWDAPAESDPLGPWVRSLAPDQPVAGPASSIALTFDRPIDPTTFTPADVQLTDPVGRPVAVTAITTADNQTFTLAFAQQRVAGSYSLTVGPNVLDTAGLPMNQDGDFTNGEASDAFTGSFDVAAEPTPIPRVETFEEGSIDALGGEWSFSRTDGTISVVPGAANSGTYALQMDRSSGSYSYFKQAAILHLDLAGQSNVVLDFYERKVYGFTSSRVSVSVDGVNWVQLTYFDFTSTYTHYSFDLDSLGLTYSSDVRIRFEHDTSSGQGTYGFDDIRVRTSGNTTVDNNPPATGTVNDGPGSDVDAQTATTSISANWTGFSDAESGIAHYIWAVGTSPGATDVVPLTNAGSDTAATATGLNLSYGMTYYASVAAVDEFGNVSGLVSSDGVTVTMPYDPAQSAVTISPTAVKTGDAATVKLTLRDSAGNPEAATGFTVAFALGTGTATGSFGPVTDHGDGTYTATFTAGAEGTNTISAAIDGPTLTSPPAAITVDDTPPTPGTVQDGAGADIDAQHSQTTIAANWSGFSDAGSGIAGYEWAIGTTPGGTDVQDYTAVGLATSATAGGLNLPIGTHCYVSVRATDAVGNVGSPATSDGVRILGPAGITVTPTTGLVTTEVGGTATFSVVLDTLPTDDVTIDLASSDPGRGTLDKSQLTFTPADALTPRLVTITGHDDGVNDGNHTYSVVVAPTVSNDPQYNDIDPDDPAVVSVGFLPKKTATLTDQDGDVYTVRLNGPGKLGLLQSDPDGDTKGPLDRLIVGGSDAIKSQLSLTVKKPTKGDGRVAVGEVEGGTLNSISLSASDIVGGGVRLNGRVGAVTVRDVKAGATIAVGGAAANKTRFTAHVVEAGVGFNFGSSLSTFKVAAVLGGAIAAPTIGTLSVTGDPKNKVNGTLTPVRGDFNADLTLTGSGDPKKPTALSRATIAGNVSGGTWQVADSAGVITVKGAGSNWALDVAGSIKSLTANDVTSTDVTTGRSIGSLRARNWVSGQISAASVGTLTVTGNLGADLSLSGAGLAVGKPALATATVGVVNGSTLAIGGPVGTFTGRDFVDCAVLVGFAPTDPNNPFAGGTSSGATLGNFHATGTFANSVVAAGSIAAASLHTVTTNNGGSSFGLLVHTSIGILTTATPALSLTNVTADPMLTGFGDFEVRVR